MGKGLNNLNLIKWLAQGPFPYTEEDAKSFINKSIENRFISQSTGKYEDEYITGLLKEEWIK